jgi:hypothetical protein
VLIDGKAGALAIGGTGGVGAGANVNILKSRVFANIDHSSVYATGAVDVGATSAKTVDSVAIMAGAGFSFGIGGAAAVTLVGDSVQAMPRARSIAAARAR